MKLVTKVTCSTILLCLTSLSAAAQNHPDHNSQNRDSFYVGLSGDIAFKQNSKIRNNGAAQQIDYKFNSGANLALGYKVTQDMRLEAEVGYHALGMKKISAGNTTINSGPQADVKMVTATGNAYYDFHNSSDFSPYVGAGVGAASVSIPGRLFGTSKSKDTQLTYQLMTGVSYVTSSMPSVNWFLGYRYISISAPQFAIGQNSGGGSLKFDRIGMSNAEIGMRYNF